MSILPLPVFEKDDPAHRTGLTDAEIYAKLEPPRSIVVKFGYMKLVGEFNYAGDAKPGCGSKLVVRTHRGTELAEMLTTTCDNAGCSKSVSRQEVREYVENSGGKDFPFHTNGRVIRVATIEDLNKHSELSTNKTEDIRKCKQLISEYELPMELVEVEPVLGEELLTFYFMAEDRVDFRELVKDLAAEFKTRIEMRQVGARDEARLVADYERCGQHCCCKNFLKVLKPVSMRAAKLQKATLDPLKISGRCGRLMCCLRYEDETYRELKKKLPHRKTRVGTSDGPGIVIEGRILVQLVLVKLEHDDREIAVPVEELMDPDECPQPGTPEFEAARRRNEPDMFRGLDEEQVQEKTDDQQQSKRGRGDKKRGQKARGKQQDEYRQRSQAEEARGGEEKVEVRQSEPGQRKKKKRSSRRRKRQLGDSKPDATGAAQAEPGGDASGKEQEGGGSKKRRSKRGRRRRGRGAGRNKPGGAGGGDGGGDGGGGGGGSSGSG